MSLSYGPQASNEDGLINESVDLKQVDRRDVVFVFFVEPHQHSFLKIISIWQAQVKALLKISRVKMQRGKDQFGHMALSLKHKILEWEWKP